MIFRRRSRRPAHVKLITLEAPTGASHIVNISLNDALKTQGFGKKIKALGLWWPNSRLGRALARYTMKDGDLLAGGMALTILISLTAALTVALTVFMALLGTYPTLRDTVFDSINSALPGVLHTDTSNGLVNPDDFVRDDIVNPTTVIGLLIATWTGLGVVGKLGRSIRTMFGVTLLPEMYLTTVGRNALGATSLVFSLVVGSGIGLVVDLAGSWFLQMIGLEDGTLNRAFLATASLVLPFVIHMAVSWVLIRLVAGIRVPARDMRWGLLIMATGAILLRILGAGVVATAKGPLLATAATLITLVLWINIQMRLTLMVAAWIANPPRALPITAPEELHFRETPNYVTMSAAYTLAWPRHEVTGEIAPAPLPAKLPGEYQPFFGVERRTLKSWLFGPKER